MNVIAECPHCSEKTKWGICKNPLPNGEICGSTEFMPRREKKGGKTFLRGYICTRCMFSYSVGFCEHCGGVIPPDFYKGQKGCFIATAVYESELSPEVVILQNFRDEILINTIFGKLFVKIYYWVSPSISNMIMHKVNLKKHVRKYILNPIVKQIMINKNRK